MNDLGLRKWPMEYQLSRNQRRQVIPKGQTRDPNRPMLNAQYLENSSWK